MFARPPRFLCEKIQYICLFAGTPAYNLDLLINLLVDQASQEVCLSFQGFDHNVCQAECINPKALEVFSNHPAKRKWRPHTHHLFLMNIKSGNHYVSIYIA